MADSFPFAETTESVTIPALELRVPPSDLTMLMLIDETSLIPNSLFLGGDPGKDGSQNVKVNCEKQRDVIRTHHVCGCIHAPRVDADETTMGVGTATKKTPPTISSKRGDEGVIVTRQTK
jgi:hypothetical protein